LKSYHNLAAGSKLSNFLLEPNLTRDVWAKLKNGQVPVVSSSDISNVAQFVDNYNQRLRSRSYIPEVVHGYLGVQKGNGVTRFLPILSKEDMAVYYHLCGHIGARVLKKKPGIYGGWRSIPAGSQQNPSSGQQQADERAAVFQNGYFSDTFSNTMWLDEFRSFTQLIRRLTKSASSGAFVATTDIANFYDSIEIPRLIDRLRRDMPGDPREEIKLLEVFLGLWDRRTTGYSRSSKGIPQEIISDGSRFLSHYYLQDFDDDFGKYCENHGLVYVRWADDMLIFGPNTKILEEAIHRASRLLLPEGLNLNAHKTKIYRRDELAKYRGVEVLSAIGTRNPADFRRKLRSAISWQVAGNQMRLDTIFRATLGYTFRLGKQARTYEKNFILETVEERPEIVATLNDLQLTHLISIADDPKEMFLKIRSACLTRPYAGARANFLMLIRKHSKKLERLGVSSRLQGSSIDAVENESADSVILRTFCVPPARAAIS
jgi:hypothetical protein